jgi:hypothetical protein
MPDRPSQIERQLREYDLYDAEILAHGFLPYLRDYRLLVRRYDPPVGLYAYLFQGCVEVRYAVTLPPDAVSMDEHLLKAESADMAPPAFQWWVGSACSSEEGVVLSHTSARALYWSDRLARQMVEIEIGTNVYRLALVFHDLVVHPAAAEPMLHIT